VLVAATGALAEKRALVPQYPYPANPQYQYPMVDSRGERIKCPKGQKPYQGVCRKWRWAYYRAFL
jgi:hypothetical protein